MSGEYPKSSVVWRGAILGGLVHAIMAAENAHYGFARSWVVQDYLGENDEGLYGTISFEGKLLVATVFDSESPRSPYRGQKNYNLSHLFKGCPSCHRCLLETRPNLAPELQDEGIRCATAAFWNDKDYLAAVDPWQIVLNEGGRLFQIELMDDIDKALACWQVEMEMKKEQLAFARSLFDRKISQGIEMLDMTNDEVAFLRSTSEKPNDEKINEERMTVCRHRLAALGILMPAT
jgi:hypothetical protein